MSNHTLRTELVEMFGEAHLEELETIAKMLGADFESIVVAQVAHGDSSHRFDGVVTADKIGEILGLARHVDAMNARNSETMIGEQHGR